MDRKKARISQGTVSVLVGCHSVMHSLLVIKAWRQIYGRWPELWEVVCILLHDVGHVGMNYLDDHLEKAEHWRLGAELAALLYGRKGRWLVAGHCQNTGFPESLLYRADKVAWSLAPMWWLVWQCLVEPELHGSEPILKHVRWFRQWARENARQIAPIDTHHAYMEACARRKTEGENGD